MAKDCSFFEEKLSAYLDNQLTSKEAAKVAAHLEQCPGCAALLDKMKHLQEMALRALPDFDEAVLSELEQRINREISKLPVASKKKRFEGFRIIPVWYRYAAVAASVAIIFLVGRATFRESMQQTPGAGAPVPIQMSNPPVLEAAPPQMEQNKPSPTEAKGVVAKRKAVSSMEKPVKVSTETSSLGATKRSVAAPIGSSQEIESVPEGRPADAAFSPAGNEKEELKAVVSRSDVSAETGADSKTAAYGAKPDTAVIDTTFSKGFSLDDLSALYKKAYAKYAAPGKKVLYDAYTSRLAASAKHDSSSGVRSILQKYEQNVASTDGQVHLKALYILMRGNYDLYRFTGDTAYYKQAALFRDSVQRYFSNQVTFEPKD